MTIAIDCRMIKSSGIGTYLSSIIPYMINNNNKYLLIGDCGSLKQFYNEKNTSILNYTDKTFSLKETLSFPTKEVNKCDVFYTPFFNVPYGLTIPVYTTIHDVVFLDMPEITSRSGYLIRKFFYKRAYKKSKKIFTVSEFSKERIKHFLGTDKEIIVTYNGISENILKEEQSYGKKNYIIFVGNIKKHKGLKTLLETFTELRQNGYKNDLVIVGEQNKFRTKDESIIKLLKDNTKNGIHFTGYISDKELIKTISQAKLLIQPSLYEGFGIPPLEALCLKTNVVLSSIAVFKEIYSGLPVTFFETDNKDSLKEAIIHGEENLTDLNGAKEIINRKYNYKKTAEIILNNLK